MLKLKKKFFYCYKDVNINYVLVSKKTSPGEKNDKYVIVTCVIIIKLSH